MKKFLGYFMLVSLFAIFIGCSKTTPTQTTIDTPWTAKAALNFPRHWLTAAINNNKIYAIGGGLQDDTLKTTEEYDPTANVWTIKSLMPTGRIGLAAATINSRIYAIGGWRANWLNIVEEYDPSTNNWSVKDTMPKPIGDMAIAVINDKIYILGGFDYNLNNSVYEYNPTNDSWVKKANMPTGRIALTAAVVNSKIYAIGGNRGTAIDDTCLVTVEEYNPLADTVGGTPWITKSSMPTVRSGLASAVVNDKIFVFGGFNETGGVKVYLSTLEVFDPIANTWQTKTSMPTARGALSAVAVSNLIYVVGGYNSNGMLSTVEMYDPSKD